MGKVEWSSFKDVPKENIYNMDDVGLDVAGRRGCILCAKKK